MEIYPSPGIHQLNITSDNKYSYNIQYFNHGNIQMDHKITFSTFYSLHKCINDHDNENSIKRWNQKEIFQQFWESKKWILMMIIVWRQCEAGTVPCWSQVTEDAASVSVSRVRWRSIMELREYCPRPVLREVWEREVKTSNDSSNHDDSVDTEYHNPGVWSPYQEYPGS